MDSEIVPWSRPLHEREGGLASVTFFVFSRKALNLSVPISRTRHGLPPGFDAGALDVRAHFRGEEPEWFEGFAAPELVQFAQASLGESGKSLPSMDYVYSVQLEVEEPRDLGYLQAAWGAVRWLCERGGELVHDAEAIQWLPAARVLALDVRREFDIQQEITITFETSPRPGFGHLAHTRGLVKFGRPDVLLMGAEPTDAIACTVLLNSLATRAALGAVLQEGQPVAPSGLPARRFATYAPQEEHPEVHLNNDGLVLDVENWGLGTLL